MDGSTGGMDSHEERRYWQIEAWKEMRACKHLLAGILLVQFATRVLGPLAESAGLL